VDECGWGIGGLGDWVFRITHSSTLTLIHPHTLWNVR
jgi:hypothetical protein